MKKKLFCILMLLLFFCLAAVPALAVDDPVTLPSVALDWGGILGNLVSGILSAAAVFIVSVIVFATVKYLIPMLPSAVQWLKERRLMWLANILVNAAEVALGRYLGEDKRKLVKQWFVERGIAITEDVELMISSAWMELNNEMIMLGLKTAIPPDPLSDTDTPVKIE